MPASFIPLKLAAYAAWMLNFSAQLTAAPATFGLVAGDAATVAVAYSAFSAAYAISTNPATRTSVTVGTTQTTRNALSTLVRTYAKLIQSNAGVSDANRVAIGLPIHDTHPTAIPAPGTAPVLALTGATPGILTLTFRDTGSSIKSRSRPAGVLSLELHALYATTAPASADATPYARDVTRSPFALAVAPGDVGKDAYLYGRWKNAKGQVGPWSALLTCGTI